MPTVEESFRAIAGVETALTAVIGARLFPDEIPAQSTPRPWAAYSVTSREPLPLLSGSRDAYTGELDATVYADTKAAAKGALDALIAAVDGKAGGCLRRVLWDGDQVQELETGFAYSVRFRFHADHADPAETVGAFSVAFSPAFA